MRDAEDDMGTKGAILNPECQMSDVWCGRGPLGDDKMEVFIKEKNFDLGHKRQGTDSGGEKGSGFLGGKYRRRRT